MREADQIRRFATLGNHLPRQCGIATFTTHLTDALIEQLPGGDGFVVAMNDAGRRHAYPSRVRFAIAEGDLSSYRALRRIRVGQDRVQRGDDGHPEVSQQLEKVRTGLAAEDPVFVLDRQQVDLIDVQKIRRTEQRLGQGQNSQR